MSKTTGRSDASGLEQLGERESAQPTQPSLHLSLRSLGSRVLSWSPRGVGKLSNQGFPVTWGTS